MTLGLVLDGSGFVRRSQTFAVNVSEAGTLETMLQNLGAPQDALVVMECRYRHRGQYSMVTHNRLWISGRQP